VNHAQLGHATDFFNSLLVAARRCACVRLRHYRETRRPHGHG